MGFFFFSPLLTSLFMFLSISAAKKCVKAIDTCSPGTQMKFCTNKS